jgi:hypothetical protein
LITRFDQIESAVTLESMTKAINDFIADKEPLNVEPIDYQAAKSKIIESKTDIKILSDDLININVRLSTGIMPVQGYKIITHNYANELDLYQYQLSDDYKPAIYEYHSGFYMGDSIAAAMSKISRSGIKNITGLLSNLIDKHGLANGSEFPAYYRAGCNHIESTPAELEALQEASKQLTPLAIVADYVAPRTGAMAANKPAKSNKTRIIKTNTGKPIAIITESDITTPEPEPIKSTTDIMRERLAKVESKPLPSELKPAKSQANKPPQYSSEVMTQIAKKIYNLPGIKLEICGAWLWVSGNTREHATELKAAGLKYASGKKMWFYAGKPAWTKFHKPMDEIRSKYGSKNIDEYITA